MTMPYAHCSVFLQSEREQGAPHVRRMAAACRGRPRPDQTDVSVMGVIPSSINPRPTVIGGPGH